MGKYFGTDGVRGEANHGLMPDFAFKMGLAGAHVLTDGHSPKIMIARDTRISGDMLEAALTAGMCSAGALVYSAGVIPTPAVAYLVKKYQLDAGVVISASHNPFSDNGIKFFNKDGYKLSDELENEIEALIDQDLAGVPLASGEKVGYKCECPDALNDYLAFLKSTLHGDFKGLKIALDCANGATSQVAPAVFFELGAELVTIQNEPDGININNNCGSTHMDGLVELVKNGDYDVAFAFDGDGDRVLAVDENGAKVEGDEIMAILGYHFKQKGCLKQDTIVATVMSNLGFFIMGKEQGINIVQTKVGDRYVIGNMLQNGYNLGGEQSGHVILLDYNTTGDGLLTALQLTNVIRETGKKLSELKQIVKILPQVLVNVKVKPETKEGYINNEGFMQELRKLEASMQGRGRVLIRPSGTEPVIRVMLEGEDKDQIQKEAERMAHLLKEI